MYDIGSVVASPGRNIFGRVVRIETRTRTDGSTYAIAFVQVLTKKLVPHKKHGDTALSIGWVLTDGKWVKVD